MSAALVEPRTRDEVWWDGFRLSLIVTWLLLLVAGFLLGARMSTLDDLERGLTGGTVRSVEVLGERQSARWSGTITQHVRWREGPVRHTAQVEVSSPSGPLESEADDTDVVDPAPDAPAPGRVVAWDVADHLPTLAPGVAIERGPWPTSYSELLGWQVPVWMGAASFIGVLATLALLMHAAEPWRATRWAWFWCILFLSPVGIAAFLVLSGPVPLVPRPRPHWRLTGGPAFVIALVVGGAIGSVTWTG